MRLILRLTARLLRAQTGRALMTLLAIVLATAMLTAIAGFLESAGNAVLDQVIASNGRQHMKVTGLGPLQVLLVKEHSAVEEAWTDPDAPDTLNIRLSKEFLTDPETMLNSLPLAALAVVFSDARVDLNLELVALETPEAPSPLGEGFVRMTGLLMAVVAACAIVVIANGFAISLSERTRRIGLLRSAGATARQMYASTLFEALLLALFGIPLGIAAGVLLQWGVLTLVMAILGDTFTGLTGVALRPALSLRLVCVSGLVALGTVLVSALRPARRAAGIAPLTAVRETGEVFVRARDARTPRWVKRLFGLEGVLAMRTMRRNRRKYMVGILSLTAAGALFISVASFALMAQRSASSGMQEEQPYDILLEMTGPDAALLDEAGALVKRYANGDFLVQQDLRLDALFPDGQRLSVSIVSVPDGPPDALLYDPYEMLLNASDAFVFPLMLPLLAQENWNGDAQDGDVPFLELSVVRQVDAPPEAAWLYGSIQLFTSQAHFDNVFAALSVALGDQAARERLSVRYWLNDDGTGAFVTDARAMIDQSAAQEHLMYGFVQDMASNRVLAGRLVLVVKLFVYGFVFMLMLIAVTSVVSTLSTGVALRQRQFALLRSAGMTPQGVRRMLRLESVLYAAYTCVLGIPLGLGIALAMHRMLHDGLAFQPAWGAVLAVIPAAYLISWLTLMLSSRKLTTLLIADTLRGQ